MLEKIKNTMKKIILGGLISSIFVSAGNSSFAMSSEDYKSEYSSASSLIRFNFLSDSCVYTSFDSENFDMDFEGLIAQQSSEKTNASVVMGEEEEFEEVDLQFEIEI